MRKFGSLWNLIFSENTLLRNFKTEKFRKTENEQSRKIFVRKRASLWNLIFTERNFLRDFETKIYKDRK